MYTFTLSFLNWQIRPQNSSPAAPGWVLLGKPEQEGRQLLSWPKPLGPTCARSDFQKPAGLC